MVWYFIGFNRCACPNLPHFGGHFNPFMYLVYFFIDRPIPLNINNLKRDERISYLLHWSKYKSFFSFIVEALTIFFPKYFITIHFRCIVHLWPPVSSSWYRPTRSVECRILQNLNLENLVRALCIDACLRHNLETLSFPKHSRKRYHIKDIMWPVFDQS